MLQILPGDHPLPLEGNGPVFCVLPSNRQNKMWWMWGKIGKQFIKPRTHIATCNYSWHWLVLRLIIATVWSDSHILTETFSYLRKIPFHELSLVADFSVYFVFYSCIIIGKLSQFEFSLCMRGYGFLNRKLSFYSFLFFPFFFTEVRLWLQLQNSMPGAVTVYAQGHLSISHACYYRGLKLLQGCSPNLLLCKFAERQCHGH